MKAYVSDFNNILLELRNRVELTRDAREADVLILWQDVRGSMKTLCEMNRDYLHKPVIVVQHGRGATRDYLAPNKFPLLCDRICVWGEAERERMSNAGYADRTVITGSPLTFYTRQFKPQTHKERVVVFSPVITSHEEPDNLIAYYELKKIELEYAQDKIRKHSKNLKNGWHAWMIDEECATEHQIPFDIIRRDFFLAAKLTPIHDQKLYHGITITTSPTNIIHLENTIKMLEEADCIVGMEEGTLQLMASALGIPTVVLDGFEYGAYGGVENYKTEIIKSPATAFCNFSNLKETIEQELSHKSVRQDAREDVTRREFDPFPDKDPIELILDVASELAGGDIRKRLAPQIEEVTHGASNYCG